MSDTVPIFSLAFTSVRPHIMPQVLELWNTRSKLNQHEWCIGIDEGNDACLAAANALAQKWPNVKVIVNKAAKTCVAGWNAAAAATTGKVIIAVADDFLPPQNWDELLLSIEPHDWIDKEHVIKVEDGYVHNIFVLSILTRKRYERFGYVFYPKYLSLFCLPLESQVYMADQTFKSIGQVRVGDLVVGSERRFGSGKKERREFLTSTAVTAVVKRYAPLIEVEFASGAKLKCTPDHPWAYYGDTRKLVKGIRQKGEGCFLYGIAAVGRKFVRVHPMPMPGSECRNFELGWLAGIYDGEGSFPVISQSETHNPEICAEIERLLTKYDFPYTSSSSYVIYPKGSKEKRYQRVYTLVGGRETYLRFLTQISPVRRATPQVLKRMLASRFGNPDRVIAVRDAGEDVVFCLKTETGNFVAEGLLSHNCDTEFGEVATRDGVVIEANHLLFEHLHPDCFKRQRDGADMTHASKERWNAGEMLFNFRRGQGFPIDDGPLVEKYAKEREQAKLSAPKTNERYVAYMQVTKDDLCLLDVCNRLVEEGVHDFCFCQPDKYWSGETIEPEHGEEINRVMDALKASGQTVHHRVFHVDSFQMPNDTRILVETRVRNESLNWIRSLGYKHILVVDGDELWMHGTLSIVKAYVEQGHRAISVHMIPVIGVPGYPVDGATDVAVVYVGADVVFKICRSPYIPQTIVYRPLIYHFTGTRKGMEETVLKHRRSGHYDDPDYDFEGWLANVLPKIKPGMQGVHMYKPRQIWPRIREWRTDELLQMPESVKPYLPSAA